MLLKSSVCVWSGRWLLAVLAGLSLSLPAQAEDVAPRLAPLQADAPLPGDTPATAVPIKTSKPPKASASKCRKGKVCKPAAGGKTAGKAVVSKHRAVASKGKPAVGKAKASAKSGKSLKKRRK